MYKNTMFGKLKGKLGKTFEPKKSAKLFLLNKKNYKVRIGKFIKHFPIIYILKCVGIFLYIILHSYTYSFYPPQSSA